MTIDTEEQFKAMSIIGEIVANCLQYTIANTKVGMTTQEVDHLAEQYLMQHGAVSAPKSEYKFPGATCISIGHCVAHGIPNDYIIKEGDLVNIDVSASRNAVFADNGQSFVVGVGHKKLIKLCKIIEKTLDESLLEVRAGNSFQNYGKKVAEIAKKHNLTVIKNLGGHGVGKSLHEDPEFVPSYPEKRDKRKFQLNSVVAIEPFLSNGAHEVMEDDDGWSLYHPKHFSVQKEHTVMVTKGKPHIFTIPTKLF